jgi:hypothetical protein
MISGTPSLESASACVAVFCAWAGAATEVAATAMAVHAKRNDVLDSIMIPIPLVHIDS